MARVLPVVFAVLLALTSPAVVVETQSAAPTPAAETEEIAEPPGFNNTTSHLSLGLPDRSGVDTPSISLSATLEMERNEIQAEKQRYTLNEKLSNAENNQEKEQILIRYRPEIKSQLSALKNQERTIRQQFNNGEISSKQYIRRLAVLHARAGDIEDSIRHMEIRGQSLPRFTPEVWRLRAELVPLQGEVRQYTVNQYRGASSEQRVFVSTTNTGVVLSTIYRDQYVRETYLPENINPDGTNQLLLQEAQNITANQYPWVQNNSGGELSTDSRFGTGIFSTTMPHKHGVITAFLDGKTEKIFREFQYKSLSGNNHIPYGESVRNESGSYVLTVNRTYPGGPLRINTTNTRGEAVSARISIGNTHTGKTGTDGVLWTVSSRQKLTVSATRQGETSNVTVAPYGVGGSNSSTGVPQSTTLPSEG